jgi:hypothetical protein
MSRGIHEAHSFTGRVVMFDDSFRFAKAVYYVRLCTNQTFSVLDWHSLAILAPLNLPRQFDACPCFPDIGRQISEVDGARRGYKLKD